MSNNQLDAQNASFLGTGWAFPPTFDRATGEVALVTAEADIQQSLEIILSTQPGERVMQPTFGCELSQFMFEDIQQGVITSIKGIVADALLHHEPRIQVNEIEVDVSDITAGLILIMIEYTIRQTNTRSNWVYPFYLKEASIF